MLLLTLQIEKYFYHDFSTSFLILTDIC